MMAMAKTDGKTDTQRLAELRMQRHTERGTYANAIVGALPRLSAKNVLTLVDVIDELVDERTAADAGGKVIPHGAHVPVDWVEYPNGRVGLDSVGNVAEVVLDDPFEVA